MLDWVDGEFVPVAQSCYAAPGVNVYVDQYGNCEAGNSPNDVFLTIVFFFAAIFLILAAVHKSDLGPLE